MALSPTVNGIADNCFIIDIAYNVNHILRERKTIHLQVRNGQFPKVYYKIKKKIIKKL